MGTVPDSLRSAKHALVVTSKEENCLEKLESPKRQHKQASIERSSNGYPFSAKVQPVGKCSFDVNCKAETSMPRGEHHCGHDISQSAMLSPGSFSLSKEDCLAAVEPVKNSGEEGSNSCHAIDQTLRDSCILMNTAIKESGTQEDCKTVASGSGGPLCITVDDKALLSPGGVVENKTHDNNSALLPTHQVFQQIAPTAKDTVDSSSGPEKIQVPPALKELRYVSDHDLKDHVCLGSELRDTTSASSHPNVRTVQEPLLKSSLESAPQPLSCNETAKEASPEQLKFKDTGTMTVQYESRTAGEETVRRTHQDAEVQAVATVESRSASTSPSILASFLRENVLSEAKQSQEDLDIICRGVRGKELPEIIDNLAVLGQVTPSGGIMPKVCIQAPAEVEKWIEAQPAKLPDEPAGRQDAACLSLLNKSEPPCPVASGCTQEISVKGMEEKRADGARSPGSVAQSLLDTSVLQKARPAYQISANTSHQPVFPPQPANHETPLPPSSALSETSSKCQQHEPSATENQLASPSCDRVLKSAIPLVTHAVQSHHQNQPQIKTLGDFEMGPASFHVDVKPKKEMTVIRLSPKEKKVDLRRAGPQTLGVPVAAQKDQEISPGNKQEVETLASQKLAAGKLASEMSSHSSPGLLSKISKMGKESRLSLLVAPSSTQPMSSPCRNKKVIKSVPSTKVHLKQSKNVRDVVWDEQGMTWEVYGASLDPESLGVAIQNHLQRQIKEHEKLINAQNVQTRKSISSDTSSNKKLKERHHNIFHNVLQNFRRPNCCVRPAASSVLD